MTITQPVVFDGIQETFDEAKQILLSPNSMISEHKSVFLFFI